jgi:ATP-binding cassette subfamily B protein
MTDATHEPWPSWRYAWRMHRFRPRRQLINLSFVFVGWGVNILPALGAKIVFDHIAHQTRGASLRWLLWPLALLGAQALARIATWFTLQSTNGAFTFANTALLQRNMLRRILQLPGGRALPSSPGEAVSRFRDDTELVAWYPIMFNNVLGSLFTGALALVVMVRISPAITAGVFLPLLLVIVIVESARTRIVLYRQANRVRTAEVTGFIADVFEAVQSIQVANAHERVVARFRELNAHRRRAAVRDRMLDELLKGAFWVVNLGTGVLLIFAGRALRSGDFTVGDLALFVYFLGVFQNFSSDIGQGLSGYRQLGVSFARMHTMLAGRPPAELMTNDEIYERGPLPSAEPPARPHDPLRELRVDGLTYRHSDIGGGIDGVSLRLPAGSFTVVTGRVGSGKTTLLQSILGLVPASGVIEWNGEVVRDPATFLAPPCTAYTPQVPQLFSETLADNILLGVDGDLDAAVRLAVLEDDVASMVDGLDSRIGSRGLRLSGGQIQRTAAARMFARRADLLVCDDLSSALDVDTEALLGERVLAVAEQRTVLAVSHRRAALSRADQVVVMRDGRVDDIGPLTDLLQRNEEMRRLWRLEEVVEDAV